MRSTRHIPQPTKFHHDCFANEGGVITDHKSLIVIFKKDVASLFPITKASKTLL